MIAAGQEAAAPLTFWLALYGSVLSTVGITLHLIGHARDRGHVRVSAMIGRILPSTPGEPLRLAITATNSGRRVVQIERVGAHLKWWAWLKQRKRAWRRLLRDYEELLKSGYKPPALPE